MNKARAAKNVKTTWPIELRGREGRSGSSQGTQPGMICARNRLPWHKAPGTASPRPLCCQGTMLPQPGKGGTAQGTQPGIVPSQSRDSRDLQRFQPGITRLEPEPRFTHNPEPKINSTLAALPEGGAGAPGAHGGENTGKETFQQQESAMPRGIPAGFAHSGTHQWLHPFTATKYPSDHPDVAKQSLLVIVLCSASSFSVI